MEGIFRTQLSMHSNSENAGDFCHDKRVDAQFSEEKLSIFARLLPR
jgi:hypothetical protein